ncbi:MAG: hypothetical protein LBS56_10775 [Propionibacteriaceae bacterium]|nr:hypothetical protein [Propionibacteriaceae bacterium]
MTAMGESGLRVLDHGDAIGPDSRGLFQQRDNGAWGSLADRMDPYISATNFFRALMAVPNRDTMTPTQVAHAVQRNADPNHYTRWSDPAEEVVEALGSVTATSSSCAVPTGDDDITQSARDLAAYAGDYVLGGGHGSGEDLERRIANKFAAPYGVDCSGFVRAVIYTATGHDPGSLVVNHDGTLTGATINDLVQKIDRSEVKPGDIAAQDWHIFIVVEVQPDGDFTIAESGGQAGGQGITVNKVARSGPILAFYRYVGPTATDGSA